MIYKRLKFIILGILAISIKLAAITYYVSPTALSSGTGTIASPFTYAIALSKSLTAGDSVIIRGGIYSFSAKQTISKSGTATAYFHLVNYKNEIPVFDFRTMAYGTAGVSISGNYVHFKGITVQGAGDNGIYVTGNYNLIEQCVSRWNCDSGFQLKTGSNNYVLNCDSYENFDYETGGFGKNGYGGNADGFADKQYTNTGINKYKGCRSWNNSDDGWDLYEKIGNTEIDSCWCYQNGPASYNMKNNIRFKTDSASWFYQFVSSSYVITNYGNGNGFKLGGNYTASNTINRFCLSANNKVKGFDQNNNNGSMTVYNCTGYYNNADFGFSNSSYGSLIAKNNASLSSRSTNKAACKTVTQSNNTWLSGFTNSSADFLSTDHTQMLNPRKADGSLPEITFMHQKSTSSMIDKGVNLGLAFAGTAPDLGAFEYAMTTDVLTSSLEQFPEIYYTSSTNSIRIGNFIGELTIFDISGRILLKANQLTGGESFGTQNWKNGIYMMRFVNENGQSGTRKILIH